MGVYWYRCWVRLQNIVVFISTTHYISNWMVNASQPREFIFMADWNGSHPSCWHFGGSLPSRLTVQYYVCFLLNHVAFSIILWGQHNTYFAKANTGAYCKIVGRELSLARNGKNAGCVSRMRLQSFAMQPRHWLATSAEAWRSEESDHSKRGETVDPSSQGQLFHFGCSSASGDDLPVREELASSDHCQQASGCCLDVPSGVPDWIRITDATTMYGGERTEGGNSVTVSTVALVMSPVSHCFKVIIMLLCTAGKGRDW